MSEVQAVARGSRTAAKRRARAHAILDAAADLVLRWGYDKTTIANIAGRAGVAKGTIYLHWSTRDALFVALFHREQADMLVGVRDRLSHGSATFHDLLREVSDALARWPLVRAALLGDSEVLGGLLRERRSRDVAGDMREGLAGYLRTLVEYGALRSDLSPAEHANIIAVVMYGFYRVPRSLLVDDMDEERLPDLVADTLQRTLGADAPLSVDVIHTVSAATFAYLDGAIEAAQQKLERSLGGPEVAA